jgi:Mn2+/Fe2+ NRAMP family transporter
MPYRMEERVSLMESSVADRQGAVADIERPAVESRAGHPAAVGPTGFLNYLRSLGPGIVVAMAWLGSGDLVDSAVSGSTYGYALMWALVIALFARYAVVNALAKYQLCNSHGDATILDGFARLWRGFPLLVGTGSLLSGFVYNSFHILASGTALYALLGAGHGTWGTFVCAVAVVVLSILFSLGRRHYRMLEWVATAAVVTLGLTFLVAAAITGPDLVGMVKGLAFSIPPNDGAFDAVLVTISLIGIVGGSVANLLYVYLLPEKGWRGPAYRRLQAYDLLAGIMSVVFINLAIWVVAAEALGSNQSIANPDDLAAMMDNVLGPFGSTLLWLGVFFAAFDNVGLQAYGYTRIFVDGLHKTFARRAVRAGGEPTRDPVFRRLQFVLLVVPLLFATPYGPDFIALTVFGGALPIIMAPVLIVALLWLLNKRDFLLPGFRVRWWENIVLFGVGAIGLWGTWKLIESLADKL